MTFSEIVTITAGNIYGGGNFTVQQSVEAAKNIHSEVVSELKASYKGVEVK